jgi:6-pyruvoyltetrahydropterin/6-carboxytetrahydropterin synthase
MFDHTMIIAKDDPHLETFMALNRIGGGYKDSGVVDLRIVDAVGCEGFAEMAYNVMNNILKSFQDGDIVDIEDQEFTARYPVSKDVQLVSVEVFEHAGNSAVYEGD